MADWWLHRRPDQGQPGPLRRAYNYGAAALPYARHAYRAYNTYNTMRTPPRTPQRTPNQRNSAGSSRGPAAGLRNPRFTSTSGKIKKSHKKQKKIKKGVTASQVKKWNQASRDAKIDICKYTYINESYNRWTVNKGESRMHEVTFQTASLLFRIGNVPYYNKTTTPPQLDKIDLNDLVVSNGDTNKAQQSIAMKVTSSLQVANNYAIPVWVDVYAIGAKGDHDEVPIQSVKDGWYDIGLDDAADYTGGLSTIMYPSGSKNFKTFWDITSHKRVCLQPGESTFLGYKKRFKYNPAVQQEMPVADFHEKLAAHAFLVRLEGTLGHDDADPTKVMEANGGVDSKFTTRLSMRYDGGGKFNQITYATSKNPTLSAGDIVVGWGSNAENAKFRDGAPV